MLDLAVQTSGVAAGSLGVQIELIEQHHADAVAGQVPCGRAARYAPADDEDIAA